MEITLDSLLEFINKLKKTVNEEIASALKSAPKAEAYCSEQIDLIATALSKAQASYEPINFSQVNPYTNKKYCELDDIKQAIKQPFAENNLSFVQILLTTDEGQRLLLTRLLHNSGQWIGSKTRFIPPLDDLHEYNSIVQEHKKTDLMALCGITAANDPYDDDAERAMKHVRNKEIRGTDLEYQNPKARPKGQSTALISKDHLVDLELELDEYPDLLKQIYKANQIESLADLPDCDYRKTVDRIRKIKELRRKNETDPASNQ